MGSHRLPRSPSRYLTRVLSGVLSGYHILPGHQEETPLLYFQPDSTLYLHHCHHRPCLLLTRRVRGKWWYLSECLDSNGDRLQAVKKINLIRKLIDINKQDTCCKFKTISIKSFRRNLMAKYYKSITESNTVYFPRPIDSLYQLMQLWESAIILVLGHQQWPNCIKCWMYDNYVVKNVPTLQISLSVSVLLALAVFLLLVAESLPSQSEMVLFSERPWLKRYEKPVNNPSWSLVCIWKNTRHSVGQIY